MRIWNLCRFYQKEIFTSKLYMGMLLLFFITFIFRFIFRVNDTFGMTDYGNLIGEIFVPIGISFLVYIVFFYRLFSDELAYGVQNFFSDSYLILLQKVLALAITHATIQGLFLTIQIGCLWVFYRTVQLPFTSFYIEAAQFMYIYYLPSTMIAFTIGIVVAMLLKKAKISFAVIFIVWLLLGPLNTTIFADYFRNIPSSSMQTFFYTTVQNINSIYRSYLGFDFSYGTLLKMIAWFFFCLFIIGICSLKWCRISRERIRMILMLVLAFAFFLPSVWTMTKMNTKAFQFSDYETELNYYQHVKNTDADLRYAIEQYKINLGNPLEVRVSLKELQTTTPSFQLHHAYPIKEILDNDGQVVEFEREGDLVHVKSGLTSELTFIYQVKDQAIQPIQRQNMMLTGSMGWYPQRLEAPVYQYNERVEKVIPTFSSKETIKFKLYSEENVITNIPKVSDRQYEGEVTSLFLLQADVHQHDFDEYTVIYPLDWAENETQFGLILELTKLIYEDLQNLKIDLPNIPTTYVFQSNTGRGQLHDQTLIYPTDSLYPIDSPYTTYLTSQKLVEAFIADATTYYEWANIVSDILALRHNLIQGSTLIPRPSSSMWLSEQDIKKAENVYLLLYEADPAVQNNILQKWYKEREILQNDWALIEQFIKEEISNDN